MLAKENRILLSSPVYLEVCGDRVISVWISAIRPKTLTAAVVPVLVGSALVFTSSFEVRWTLTFCALFAALFIQVGTNLLNDAFDFKKGADTHDRLGPTRVTQAGLIEYKSVLWAGVFSFVIAVLFGIPLIQSGGLTIVVIGIASLLCGYAYTAGPYPLAYLGLGDFFVIVFFGLVAVAGTFFLHAGKFSASAFVAGLQVGLLCSVLIAINNLRDIDGDARAHKKTLPVRFGKTFARREIAVLVSLPFFINAFWLVKGLWIAGILPMVLLPMGCKLIAEVYKTDLSTKFNDFLGQAAKLHLLFGIFLSVGFVL